MAKNKLQRFEELHGFENVFEPTLEDTKSNCYFLKGNWNKKIFRNQNPITIELGCGRGEYSLEMARMFPDKNFIGVDIKGARMWQGAKVGLQENLKNLVFLRVRIEFISAFFSENEVSQIWLTFSDPQPKKPKKRLTSSIFLKNYAQFLNKDGLIHLKTDNYELFKYTIDVIKLNELNLVYSTEDLYKTEELEKNPILKIRTYYENLFLKDGKKITYLKFNLDSKNIFVEPLYLK